MINNTAIAKMMTTQVISSHNHRKYFRLVLLFMGDWNQISLEYVSNFSDNRKDQRDIIGQNGG
ncbi:hypothetical protein [Echinicola sediminis]